MEQDYTPYGEEWAKELSKLPKPLLIGMLKKAHEKRHEAVDCLANYAKVMEQFLANLNDDYVIDIISAAVVQDAHKQAKEVIKAN